MVDTKIIRDGEFDSEDYERLRLAVQEILSDFNNEFSSDAQIREFDVDFKPSKGVYEYNIVATLEE